MGIKIERWIDGVKFCFSQGEFTCRVDELPPDVVRACAVRGISEMVKDAYASAQTEKEAKEKAGIKWEAMKAGNVRNARELVIPPMLIAACIRMGLYENEKEFHEEVSGKEKLEELKANVRIKACIKMLKAEEAFNKLTGKE